MIEVRDHWRTWVTPKPLKTAPIHRWYTFPHSFTGDLVGALIDEWGLSSDDRILDPFAGAGTTILAAKAKGVPAAGFDLSPLAVFVSKVKTRDYRSDRLKAAWDHLYNRIRKISHTIPKKEYSELVTQALPPGILGTLEGIDGAIEHLRFPAKYRSFFRLALLSLIPLYSRAVASGGWLAWVENNRRKTSIAGNFADIVGVMLSDLKEAVPTKSTNWSVHRADARNLPEHDKSYTAVITSPPYPNRHDYTRVFGVELMFGFLDWEGTRRLRYQSFHSHPEARPKRPPAATYVIPRNLNAVTSYLQAKSADPKVIKMLEGYFLDTYLYLKEVHRVCSPGAKVAVVVGNAQYHGLPLIVDDLVAELGQQVGLIYDRTIAVRFRGNSAQQMGAFGRNPSREGVVLFHRSTDDGSGFVSFPTTPSAPA